MAFKKVILVMSGVLVGAITMYAINFYSIIEVKIGPNSTQEIAYHASEHAHEHSHSTDSHDDETQVHLTTSQIERLNIQTKVAGPGQLNILLMTRGKIILHPDRLAHIIPKVSGVAKEAYKNIGNVVKTNELMAVLESREIATVKAAYLLALSKQRLAKTAFEREERLYQEKVSAGQDYLNAKNANEEANINVELAIQQLRAFGMNNEEIDHLGKENESDLRLYSIRSPIDGTVLMRHLTKGEYVENSTTVYQVADLRSVWVEIGIYPKDLGDVKVGQLVEVLLPEHNQKAQARLIYVSPIISEDTITAGAIAELDNSEGLWKPGMFVKVEIISEKISRPLVISKEAIQTNEGKDFVFIPNAEGFEKNIVTLGQSDGENVEILSGLKTGQLYVTNQTFLLKAEMGKKNAEHEH